MINIVVELSKYVIDTDDRVHSFVLLPCCGKHASDRKGLFKKSDHFNLFSGFYRICCDFSENL